MPGFDQGWSDFELRRGRRRTSEDFALPEPRHGALVEQVLRFAQQKREADIHHHRQANELDQGLEIAKRIAHPGGVTADPLTGRFL